MTDKELNEKLAALNRGERQAFEEIYNEISTSAFTVALRITGDRHLSEDILQEFFVRLYRKPPEAPLEKPRAYLMRIVHNLTLDCLKKQPHNADIEDYSNKLCAEEDRDGYLDLAKALGMLTDSERRIVVLHINGGLKFREISDIMDIPLGTALWKYRRALSRLKDVLNGGE